MDHATSLGQAAAEEWVKGLDNVGRQKMEDSKRFEHFEATGSFEALRQSQSKKVTVIKHNPPAKPALPVLPLPSVPTHAQATSDSAGSQTQSPLSAQHKPSPPGTNRFPGCTSPFAVSESLRLVVELMYCRQHSSHATTACFTRTRPTTYRDFSTRHLTGPSSRTARKARAQRW